MKINSRSSIRNV